MANLAKALQITYIPYAVIVDAEGRVVWSGHSGRLSKAGIEKKPGPKKLGKVVAP